MRMAEIKGKRGETSVPKKMKNDRRKEEMNMKNEKTWVAPSMEEVNISQTENGGEPSMNFDQQWFDEKGALHATFGNTDKVS